MRTAFADAGISVTCGKWQIWHASWSHSTIDAFGLRNAVRYDFRILCPLILPFLGRNTGTEEVIFEVSLSGATAAGEVQWYGCVWNRGRASRHPYLNTKQTPQRRQ